MPGAVTMHRVESADSALLARIAEDVFDDVIDTERLRAYLAEPTHALFVAVEEGMVIGQIRGIVHLQPDRGSDLYVDNLGVTPGHQRRGIATALLRALIAWGQGRGCTSLWVAAELENGDASAFYKSAGLEAKTLGWFSRELM